MATAKKKYILFLILTLSLMVVCASSFGAEVVMKSGERFQTSQVWEHGEKVRFNMHGLVVDVAKDDVVEIIQGQVSTPPGLAAAQPSNDIKVRTAPNPLPKASATGYDASSANTLYANAPSPAVQKQPLKMSNRGTGVQGIYWQMKPQEISGMQKIETDPAFGGIDQYWRPTQSLKWGEVALDGWVYGFWQDQLYAITMWINGWGGYEKLHKQVKNLFGPGSQNRDDKECYVWIDPANQRMLEFDRKLGTGILIMRSSSVDAQIKKRYPGP